MSNSESEIHESLRALLCDLGNAIRDQILAARSRQNLESWSDVAHYSEADTIYAIDKVSEETILSWFEANWPISQPLEIVMEGLDEETTFPFGTPVEKTVWKGIFDPIDGTRGLMHDKRSAWSLAALAPQKGQQTRLSDICIAAMTEIPISKQWRADQISGVTGCGREGLKCDAVNVLNGEWMPISLRPSGKRDFKHGFSAISRFFPEGKALLAEFEAEIWDALYGLNFESSPVIFDDQYISNGGQLYEIMAGHDRMNGDLRPFALRKIGFDSSLVAHPYDMCTAMLAREAGVIVEAPDGSPLDAPLDTTSPVAYMAYANEYLAAQIRPLLPPLMEKYFSL